MSHIKQGLRRLEADDIYDESKDFELPAFKVRAYWRASDGGAHAGRLGAGNPAADDRDGRRGAKITQGEAKHGRHVPKLSRPGDFSSPSRPWAWKANVPPHWVRAQR